VAGQIVHDDDVKGASVDRAVEDERRDHASRRQASNESRRFPVAVGDADAQSLAAAATAMRSGHAGRGPGLIGKDETLGIEIELLLEPGAAPRTRPRGASGYPADRARWRARSFLRVMCRSFYLI
jgi:hypothetical protein